MATIIVAADNTGDFTSVQAAINAASDGDIIQIKPGRYVETGQGSDVNRSGLTIDKDVTLQGVDANGAPITDASKVQATIVSGFMSGDNTSIRITESGVTIAGLGFDALPSTPGGFTGGFLKALVSVMADDVTITESSFVSGKSSYAIELNGTGLFGTAADSYTITDNLIGGPIWLLEGVGDGAGGDEIISGNTFFGTAADGTQSGIFVMGGAVAGYAPTTPSLPTDMSDNTFAEGLPVPFFIRTNVNTDPAGIVTAADLQAFADANLSGATDTYAFVLNEGGAPLQVRVGTGANRDVYVASSAETLSDYQEDGIRIGAGNPIFRDTITDNDTLVLKTVGATTVTLRDENLTIRAAAGSDDLTLNLAETAFVPNDTWTTAVNDVTLADYAPGQGADVDVNGNALDNQILGNSGDNVLKGFGGSDLLVGGGGNDVIDGGDGSDATRFSGNRDDYSVVRNADGSFTVTDLRNGGTDGSDRIGGVETFTFADGARTSANLVNASANLQGGNGADTFADAAGRDAVYAAGNGNDVASGGDGSDTLLGQNGDDRLDGGTGRDQLSGGNGRDTLNGGAGDDTLSGGNGDDTFVFTGAFDDDAVLDFKSGDRLDIDASINIAAWDTNGDGRLTDADDRVSFLNGDLVVSFDQGSITLAGLNQLALDAWV